MYRVRARPREYSIVQPYRYINSRVERYCMVDSYLNSDRSETISKRRSIFLAPKRYYRHYYIRCIIQCDYDAIELTLNIFVERPPIYFTLNG